MLRRLYTNHFAVGNTTTNGDGVKDWDYSDPIRNGDAFETLGYSDPFVRREGRFEPDLPTFVRPEGHETLPPVGRESRRDEEPDVFSRSEKWLSSPLQSNHDSWRTREDEILGMNQYLHKNWCRGPIREVRSSVGKQPSVLDGPLKSPIILLRRVSHLGQ